MLLSEVVGAVLADLVAAQDTANEFASQMRFCHTLNPESGNKTLGDGQVAVGQLKTLELDLKFAFDAGEDCNDSPTFGAAIAAVQEYIRKAASCAIARLKEFMHRHQHFAEDPAQWHQIIQTLGSQRFLNALTQETTECVFHQCGDSVGNNWVWNADVVPGAVLTVLEQQLLNPGNFRATKDLETPASRAFRANYQQILRQIAPELGTMASTLGEGGFPTAGIAISAERLKQLQPGKIAAVKIKAVLNG